MSDWGSGYVTDISYMPGWYRQQSPAMMAIAALLGNVAANLPGPDDDVAYLELGCGQGYSAMILAASNPGWTVTAIDFNPAHIAAARDWAAEAGLENIRFIEADLSTLAEAPASRDIPEADFVSLHGVWSWTPAAVQAGIVRLLAAKVRPGGIVHMSYNVLPGWGSALGMQKLLREAGRRLAFRSDRQIVEALKIAKDLVDADAAQLKNSPFALHLLGAMDSMPVEYLAHEYMNASWAPCYHSDVATALGGAKLEFVAASQLTENFQELILKPPQLEIMRRFDDPAIQELIKDICMERMLRHDLFVRGARPISPRERNGALMDVSLALTIQPVDLPLEVELPIGKAELSRAFYGPVTEALVNGPRRIGELLSLPNLVGRRDNPAELIAILVGHDFAEAVSRPTAEAGRQAMRFNRTAARRHAGTVGLSRNIGIASHRLGTGLSTSILDVMVLDRVLAGETDIDALVGYINAPPDKIEILKEIIGKSMNIRLPILRAAGVW
jgi:predicted O-methyltransferase YrrM